MKNLHKPKRPIRANSIFIVLKWEEEGIWKKGTKGAEARKE